MGNVNGQGKEIVSLYSNIIVAFVNMIKPFSLTGEGTQLTVPHIKGMWELNIWGENIFTFYHLLLTVGGLRPGWGIASKNFSRNKSTLLNFLSFFLFFPQMLYFSESQKLQECKTDTGCQMIVDENTQIHTHTEIQGLDKIRETS